MIHGTIRIGKILLIFILIQACNPDKSKLTGTYVAKEFKLSVDTLILKEEGIYYHSIYDKSNGKFVFSNTGYWAYNNGEIELSNYLRNVDDIKYHNDSVSYDNSLIDNSMTVINRFDKVKLIIFKDLNYFYVKIN